MTAFQHTIRAVVIGMLILIVGTIPRNLVFEANLRYYISLPWAVPLLAVYMWFFWRYLDGHGPPTSTMKTRRFRLRANRISGRVWAWSIFAGMLGIITLVFALHVINRLIVLPQQKLPELSQLPSFTILSLLLVSAPVAAIIEEAAFRGYMQGTIERHYGLPIAILITGTMFAIAHLDFTLILWPYYLAVAAIYGTVTYLTNSILPAVVLHTAGNIYSNLDLWIHGKAEWQTSSSPEELIWSTGTDKAFWIAIGIFVLLLGSTVYAYLSLANSVSYKSIKPS